MSNEILGLKRQVNEKDLELVELRAENLRIREELRRTRNMLHESNQNQEEIHLLKRIIDEGKLREDNLLKRLEQLRESKSLASAGRLEEILKQRDAEVMRLSSVLDVQNEEIKNLKQCVQQQDVDLSEESSRWRQIIVNKEEQIHTLQQRLEEAARAETKAELLRDELTNRASENLMLRSAQHVTGSTTASIKNSQLTELLQQRDSEILRLSSVLDAQHSEIRQLKDSLQKQIKSDNQESEVVSSLRQMLAEKEIKIQSLQSQKQKAAPVGTGTVRERIHADMEIDALKEELEKKQSELVTLEGQLKRSLDATYRREKELKTEISEKDVHLKEMEAFQEELDKEIQQLRKVTETARDQEKQETQIKTLNEQRKEAKLNLFYLESSVTSLTSLVTTLLDGREPDIAVLVGCDDDSGEFKDDGFPVATEVDNIRQNVLNVKSMIADRYAERIGTGCEVQ
eukprot:GFYU01037048.1.p1 GENE.GFYU01037048.1~~GFYU01037048.1.p1  ORF type:complete len:537 (-),score=88.84 GFYU01037048.1:96-1466(-)